MFEHIGSPHRARTHEFKSAVEAAAEAACLDILEAIALARRTLMARTFS